MAGPSRPRRIPAPVVLQCAVVLGFVALNLLQQPGRLTFDTKLDLQLDPVGFMRRSLDLWNPQAAVGELQNQATGYLFPLGPFFALGSGLGVPMWLWERLWTTLVMLAAYDGARRLSARWVGCGATGAVVAGLAYALAPRVLTTVAGLSGETLPTAVLPWTVLPVVGYLAGRWRRGTALVASAATVLAMGGQNATEVIACLVFPALVLVGSGAPLRRRAGDLAAWGLLVAAVTVWWWVPLLLLGRYSPPFLDFIESALNTTSAIGTMAALRGADHWVAYLPGGSSSGWQGGWMLVSSGWLVGVTAVVAAVGLAGLTAVPGRPRRVLMASLVVGLLVLTLGSAGWDASPVRDVWLNLLDGVLAPFRNVHKFDPLVRLPLSLGAGAAVGAMLGAPRRGRHSVGPGRLPRTAVAAVALAVLASAAPGLAGELRPTHGFRRLPSSWTAAAAYLASRPGPTRVLVLPGSGFGIQTWGRTIDTPLQVLDPPPWVVRGQTPLVPPQTTLLLDSIEQLATSGRPADGLADTLRRLGITQVLVRHDLDPAETDAPPASVVHDALVDTSGFRLERTFGGVAGEPLLEVFGVVAAGSEPRVRAVPADHQVDVRGGAASVLPLVRAGLLPYDAVLVPDHRPGRATAVVTDVERRLERSFGRVHEAVSDVMTRHQPFRVRRARHDYEPPVDLTVARYAGVGGVMASSSTGYADTAGPVRPEQAPWAALDGSLLTSWSSALLAPPVGQWIEVRFRRPTRPGTLRLLFDTRTGADVRAVHLDTDRWSLRASVGSDGRVSRLPLPRAPVRRLRLTITAVHGPRRPVRLTELSFQHVAPTRALVVPGVVGPATTVLLTSDPGGRACHVAAAGQVSCPADSPSVSTEEPGFTRILHVVGAGRRSVRGTVVATNGPAVAALLEPLSPRPGAVRATSFLGGDPAVGPQNAFDGDPATTWVAAPGDRRPVLDLRWATPRVITRIRPSLVQGTLGRLPSALRVISDQGTQTVAVGPDSLGVLRPVRTRHLRIALEGAALAAGTPFAVSELGIVGLEPLTYRAPGAARTGAVCGFGPTLVLGGVAVRTRVVGTVGEVLTGRELALQTCGPVPRLPAGRAVSVVVRNAPGFAVTSLSFIPAAQAAAAPSEPPSVRVRRWGPSLRLVRVHSSGGAVLLVPQSANAGWTATLAGRRLAAVAGDGWMQGWLLPAGADGTVRLQYIPQPVFQAGVLGGLGLALTVVALLAAVLVSRRAGPAGVPLRRGPHATRQTARSGAATAVAILALAGVAVLSVPLTLGLVVGLGLRRTGRGSVATAAAVLVGVAGVWAAVTVHRSVVAPTSVDVMVAVAVGLVVGREAVRDDPEDGGSAR